MAFFDISERIQVVLIAAALAASGCYASGGRDHDGADAGHDPPADTAVDDAVVEELPTGQAYCTEIEDGTFEAVLGEHTNDWAIVELTYGLGREFTPGEAHLLVELSEGHGSVDEIHVDGTAASFRYHPTEYDHLDVGVDIFWQLECVGPEGLTTEVFRTRMCIRYFRDPEGNVEYWVHSTWYMCDPVACLCHAPVIPFSLNTEATYSKPFAVYIQGSPTGRPGTVELVPDVREATGRIRHEWKVTSGRAEHLPGGRILWHVPLDVGSAIAQLTVRTDYGFCIQTYRHEA